MDESISDVSQNEDATDLLIELIQRYPFLYCVKHKDYKNNIKKENAWRKIGKILRSPVPEVQKLWRSLRDRYTRERRHEGRSGAEAPSTKWFYYDKMAFYGAVSKPRKTLSNIKIFSSAEQTSSHYSLAPPVDIVMPPNLDTSPLTSPSSASTSLVFEFDTQQQAPFTLPTSFGQQAVAGSSIAGSQSHPARRKKEATRTEDALVSVVQQIAERLKNPMPEPGINRAFTEYVYMVLQEMPSEEAKKKREDILKVLINDQ